MQPIILLMLLADVVPINSSGSIDAAWVLVGMTGVAFFLFWRMLWKIEKTLEALVESVNEHNTKLKLHDQSFDTLYDDVEEIKRARKTR